MKKILVLLSLLCLPCFASNWVEVGYKMYTDISSYREYTRYNYTHKDVTAWVKMLNIDGSLGPDNIKWWFILEYDTFYWGERKYSTSDFAVYDLKGNVFKSFNFQNFEKKAIPPDSRIEDVYNYYCKY